MSEEKQYTHSEMVAIMDEAKKMMLSEVEVKVEALLSQTIGGISLISKDALLKDLIIIRLENGLEE